MTAAERVRSVEDPSSDFRIVLLDAGAEKIWVRESQSGTSVRCQPGDWTEATQWLSRCITSGEGIQQFASLAAGRLGLNPSDLVAVSTPFRDGSSAYGADDRCRDPTRGENDDAVIDSDSALSQACPFKLRRCSLRSFNPPNQNSFSLPKEVATGRIRINLYAEGFGQLFILTFLIQSDNGVCTEVFRSSSREAEPGMPANRSCLRLKKT